MGIDPISLLMIAGSGVQAYSSIAGAEASAGNMRAQAAAMEANALQLERSNKVIDYQRQEEATAGALKTQQLSARQKLIAGQQAAALGSGGLAGNLGLGLDLDMSNLNRYYADRYLVELQGWNTDRNLRQQQNDNSSQADIYKSQASSLRSQAGKTARMGWISGLGGLALNIGTLKAQGLLDKRKNAAGDKDADNTLKDKNAALGSGFMYDPITYGWHRWGTSSNLLGVNMEFTKKLDDIVNANNVLVYKSKYLY